MLKIGDNNCLFWLKVWPSRNQFEPVCSSFAENLSKLPCTETEINQLPKQVHRSPRRHMKDSGQGYIKKGQLLITVLVKALLSVEVRGKSPFFSSIFVFFGNTEFLKDSSNTRLYLLDLIWIWPLYGLLQYAKLPNYKRMRWGQLAVPSYMQLTPLCQWLSAFAWPLPSPLLSAIFCIFLKAILTTIIMASYAGKFIYIYH